MPHDQPQRIPSDIPSDIPPVPPTPGIAPPLGNWIGSVRYQPAVIVYVRNIADVRRVVKDTQGYPGPVRGKGSHHSTSNCVENEGGTVLDMTGMNHILEIDFENKTVTVEAGVLLIDAAKELERHGLQFFVNIELGNLTCGSGACCATKDASYYSDVDKTYEFSQVSSYVTRLKIVNADGEIETIEQAQDLEAFRSSYGMLGVVCEVTFKVKVLRPMAVEHVAYDLADFADQVDEIADSRSSNMLYLFPFLNKVVVEKRSDGDAGARRNRWIWPARNYAWETLTPAIGKLARTLPRPLQNVTIDSYARLLVFVMTKAFRARHTHAPDQQIKYPPKAGYCGYTFSIWAFPQQDYPTAIREYFKFCRDYHQENGFRCDMPNVGYAIQQDKNALFSYTRDWPALTLDPVTTPARGWQEFLKAYNRFCSEHDGRPLLNQTPNLGGDQVKRAFGGQIDRFLQVRRERDPGNRFYTEYFRQLFE